MSDERTADALAVVLAARHATRTGNTADLARLIAQSDDVDSLCVRLALITSDLPEPRVHDLDDESVQRIIARLRLGDDA